MFMFVVEKIEENIVVLENRDTKELLEIEKKDLPNNLKEGIILDFKDNKFYVNTKKTNLVKDKIRMKFDLLKNKK